MIENAQPKPTIFAVFGGSGDLTWRKLVPALFDLFQDLSMPPYFSIIVLDRVELNDEELRHRFRDGIEQFSRKDKPKDDVWSRFSKHIYYKRGDFTKPEVYTYLKEAMRKIGKRMEFQSSAYLLYGYPT